MDKVRISVVIPCRNEVKYIEECIQAIYQNELHELILLSVFVVDGMSDDGTRTVVKELESNFPSLKLIDNTKQLTPFAFNIGIHEQEADYIQIIGARHIVSPNYISKSLSILEGNKDIWCVGGRLINEFTNEVSSIISKAMDTSFGMGIGNFRILEMSGYTDTVTSPMYPFWVFDKIGFFDEQLVRNQDDDFNFRVTNAGGKIWFEKEISLRYYVRANYKGLYKQFFQYGYWKVFVNKKHKAVTTIRQLVPPLFVLFILLAPFFILLNNALSVLTFFGLGFYILLGIYFSVKKAGKTSEIGGIAITFPILHFSYGLGYLLGIWHFLFLKKTPADKQKKLSR
jgi:GT2 family glycosyltransferase